MNCLRIKLLSGQDPQVTLSGNWFNGPTLAIHVILLSETAPTGSNWIVFLLFSFLVSGAPLSLIPREC